MTPYDQIRIAFRKLKASVYFDKTTLPLRDKVVEFESRVEFEAKLEELAEAYDNELLNENSPVMTEILESPGINVEIVRRKNGRHTKNMESVQEENK
jgi:hypothetical protein